MSSNTGLLTARCDPYGAESQIRLLGGMYPESWNGNIHWHCSKQARARYRMTCTGGEYGQRVAADGGILPVHICDGGHVGVIMPLCDDHRRGIAKRQSDMCPACMWPPQGRMLQEQADYLQMAIAQRRGDWARAGEIAGLMSQLDQVIAGFNHLMERGIVHKCPLRLIEVS